jgi:hypothetical protein
MRLSPHPDQFVVLNSPNPMTLAHSLAELSYQAEVAEWTGADTVNVHGGGAYRDNAGALRTVRQTIERLPASVRSQLTLENDDKVYTPRTCCRSVWTRAFRWFTTCIIIVVCPTDSASPKRRSGRGQRGTRSRASTSPVRSKAGLGRDPRQRSLYRIRSGRAGARVGWGVGRLMRCIRDASVSSGLHKDGQLSRSLHDHG